MIRQYSSEIKGLVDSYSFSAFEEKSIAQGLKIIVKRMDRQIERIKNHPKNEGQAKYSLQIQSLRFLQEDLEDIIKEFDKP